MVNVQELLQIAEEIEQTIQEQDAKVEQLISEKSINCRTVTCSKCPFFEKSECLIIPRNEEAMNKITCITTTTIVPGKMDTIMKGYIDSKRNL